jgi:transcriptional regulator with XRE-family HTH domain
VADERGPTIRRRRLAAELRRQRAAAQLTLAQAAARLGDGWSSSKLSRVETARLGISPPDLRRLLDLYGVTESRRGPLLALARKTRSRGWWDAYSPGLPGDYASYIELESEAAALRCFDAVTVHGLLQTEDYARGVISAGLMALSPPAETDRRVDVRMTRQRLLRREPGPLRLWAVIHEAALRCQVGSAAIMRAQYARLAELAGLPNVVLQVLPNTAGAHPGTAGTFSILEFPGPHDPAVAYVETLTGNLFAETDAEVHRYTLAFSHLSAMALGPGESRAFIARLAAARRPSGAGNGPATARPVPGQGSTDMNADSFPAGSRERHRSGTRQAPAW